MPQTAITEKAAGPPVVSSSLPDWLYFSKTVVQALNYTSILYAGSICHLSPEKYS